MKIKHFNITAKEIFNFLGTPFLGIDFPIYYACPLNALTENSLGFVTADNYSEDIIKSLPPTVLLIVPSSFCKKNKENMVLSADPMYDFMQIIAQFLIKEIEVEPQIHPTAIIDSGASIHPSVKIGAFSIIDNCIIGEGCIIKEHVHIHDAVELKKNITIYPSCEIGTNDFGPLPDKNGNIIMFPQIGNLVIENNVEIYPFTAIGRGTLGSTLIKEGAKIDHCCQIGHNTIIGKNTVITANTMILGSSEIGDNCWIGSGSVIKNQLKLGSNTTVGIGSVVTKSFGNDLVIAGNPAAELNDIIKQKKEVREIVEWFKTKQKK